MKLAKALLLRGDLQKKLVSLRDRISRNVLVQQGDKPQEDPSKLLSEADETIAELQRLVVSINTVNIANRLPDGRSLTQAIADRDSLVQRHAIFQAAIKAAQVEPERYSNREIKWSSAVDLAQLQRQSEDVSKQLRELNAAIQETNWQIDM